MKIKCLIILTILLCLVGCKEKPFYVASIGNAGSLDGPYSMGEISVADVLGGGGGFGYGAVNGYLGASADIGRMGVPKHIEGYWAKKYPTGGFQYFYRISADIDSDLAEKKIRTLRNYYQVFKGKTGSMQVLVERELEFFTRFTVPLLMMTVRQKIIQIQINGLKKRLTLFEMSSYFSMAKAKCLQLPFLTRHTMTINKEHKILFII